MTEVSDQQVCISKLREYLLGNVPRIMNLVSASGREPINVAHWTDNPFVDD
jgi:hypothetical protein